MQSNINTESNLPDWATSINLDQSLWSSLTTVVEADCLENWFNHPNSAFDGKSPREIWTAGDRNLILSMAEGLASGRML